MDDLCVDFSDIILEDRIENKQIVSFYEDSTKKQLYKKNGISVVYNRKTEYTYVSCRKLKIDPIFGQIENIDTAFQYKWEWDPFSGTIVGEDPHGPLYFDVDTLIDYFYFNRTHHLWVPPKDSHDGYFEGYYDCGIGAGENFKIIGRGEYPEWYLFRLPIDDCYLTDEQEKSPYPRLGPKLTDAELQQIDNLAILKMKKEIMFNQSSYQRISVVEMKKLYNIAISINPEIPDNLKDVDNAAEIVRRNAVDQLEKMTQYLPCQTIF